MLSDLKAWNFVIIALRGKFGYANSQMVMARGELGAIASPPNGQYISSVVLCSKSYFRELQFHLSLLFFFPVLLLGVVS